MRDLMSKLITGSMIAGAALFVSACGGGESANTAETNLTEMNSMEPLEGTVNDVTAVDGAMGADANVATDSNMSSSSSAMDSNMSSSNMTTNAM